MIILNGHESWLKANILEPILQKLAQNGKPFLVSHIMHLNKIDLSKWLGIEQSMS